VNRTLLLVLILGASPLGGAVAQSSIGGAATALSHARGVTVTADTGSAGERDREGDECLGFSFGAWTPPLDAKAAGHSPFPPAASLPQAPGGRGWAINDSTSRDTLMLLFPSWWPAGVSVRFAHAPRAPGDTVRGIATALVADGRVRSPEAEVMTWLVRCRR
jgi:hypothetical protein